MYDHISIPSTTVSFKDYLIKNELNRIILVLSFAAIIIQFSIFKYYYPYPSFIHNDSFVYLETAYFNLDINSYLVGYSRFLRLFSSLTSSDYILVAFQYLLVETSTLFFVFTIFYFFRPQLIIQVILVCFSVINPLHLQLSNLISSDCFFLSLSLVWLSLLVWTICKPSFKIVIYQSLFLFFSFTVRYNALIYPVISILAISLSTLTIYRKIFGIALGIILCGAFVFYTGNKYKSLTGNWQYSPFSGWQLANNAMYAYRFVDIADRVPVPDKFHILDYMIRTYFDSSRDLKKNPHEALLANTQYMWSPGLPLHKYMKYQFTKDTISTELEMWASMGPLYKDYGSLIIKTYPKYFIKHFIWPNANKYYTPPVEYLETYNRGRNYVLPIAKEWFNYKSVKIFHRSNTFYAPILNLYPILNGVVNVLFLCNLICFIILKRFNTSRYFQQTLIVISTLWLFNAAFTIFASSAALRFQAFPMLVTYCIDVILINWIYNTGVNHTKPFNTEKEVVII